MRAVAARRATGLVRQADRVMLLTHAEAKPALGKGVVEAYTSVFGVEFQEGGGFKAKQVVIEPGAFDQTLQDKPTAPIMWEHAWDYGPIGVSTEEAADEVGLHMVGKLFVDQDLPSRVYRAMLPAEEGGAGALTEWSIGFWPISTTIEERGSEDDGEPPLYHYDSIDRAEHSVVLRGANPLTETISVNSGGVFQSHGLPIEERPCVGMPSEFTIGGRCYRASSEEGIATARAAERLPGSVTFAGVEYQLAPITHGYEPEPYRLEPDETVKCQSCEKMNASDSVYCDQCGVKLSNPGGTAYAREDDETVQCPSCERYNEPDARYCDQCGIRLEGRDDVGQSRGRRLQVRISSGRERRKRTAFASMRAIAGERLRRHQGVDPAEWDELDDIDQLCFMLMLGVDFMDDEEDEDGIIAMRSILSDIVALIQEEIGEEPEPGEPAPGEPAEGEMRRRGSQARGMERLLRHPAVREDLRSRNGGAQ